MPSIFLSLFLIPKFPCEYLLLGESLLTVSQNLGSPFMGETPIKLFSVSSWCKDAIDLSQGSLGVWVASQLGSFSLLSVLVPLISPPSSPPICQNEERNFSVCLVCLYLEGKHSEPFPFLCRKRKFQENWKVMIFCICLRTFFFQ